MRRRLAGAADLLKNAGTARLPIEVRLDAAKVAINYEIPRLSAVDAKVGVEAGVTSSLNDEQRRERARRMIAEAFAERPPVVEGKFRVIAGRDVGDAEHDGEARPADDEPA